MKIDLSRYIKRPPNACPTFVGERIVVKLGSCTAPYFDLSEYSGEEIVLIAGGDEGCDLILTDSLSGGGHVIFVDVYPQKTVIIPPNKLNPLYIMPSGPQGKKVWVNRYATVGQPSQPTPTPTPPSQKPNIRCVQLTYKVSGEKEGKPLVKFTAVFYNFGGYGSQKFTIRVDGKAVGSFYVTLGKGGQTTVSFVLELIGMHTVCVDGKCVSVNVSFKPTEPTKPAKQTFSLINSVAAGVLTGVILIGIRELIRKSR